MFRHWAKRLGQSQPVQHVLASLGAFYIRCVIYTSTWTIEGIEHPRTFWDQKHPILICAWHERLIMAGHPCVQRPLVILASAHRDGQIIATFLRRFGLDIVSGSTGRGGDRALRSLLRLLKRHIPVAIATDGPRGPGHRVQPGIAGLARLTQTPVIPFSWSARKVVRLKTWDRLMVPLPFNQGIIAWGKPIYPGQEVSDHHLIQQIQTAMNHLTLHVDAFIQNVA